MTTLPEIIRDLAAANDLDQPVNPALALGLAFLRMGAYHAIKGHPELALTMARYAVAALEKGIAETSVPRPDFEPVYFVQKGAKEAEAVT